METPFIKLPRFLQPVYSDPTYEAWKHHCVNPVWLDSAFIPILPMRHGNVKSLMLKSEYIEHSDPTYEAWKPTKAPGDEDEYNIFRSYLRGMETES